MFSPGKWWVGLILNRSGSFAQLWMMHSMGVRPLRVFIRLAQNEGDLAL